MQKFRNALIFIFLVFMVSGLGAALYINSIWHYQNPETIIVSVPRGTSVRALSRDLKNEHVIQDALIFEIYLRMLGQAQKMKAGDYEFEAGATLRDVATKMIEGKTKLYQFTIPEGYTLKDVCRLFSEKNIMSIDECTTLGHDVSFIKNDPTAQSLEGYLFPETYTYDSQTTPRDIFKNMVAMFYEKVGSARFAQATTLGLSPHDLVVFASVVEKETGQASERPIIAGVFHNRLKIGMLLQSDPTTIYGIPNFNGNLTRADLARESDYNTYTRPGLPIGPICNPGLAALDAVLHPTTTNALYFVAKGDGSHYFSTTLAEHNEAVNRYQRRGGSK